MAYPIDLSTRPSPVQESDGISPTAIREIMLLKEIKHEHIVRLDSVHLNRQVIEGSPVLRSDAGLPRPATLTCPVPSLAACRAQHMHPANNPLQPRHAHMLPCRTGLHGTNTLRSSFFLGTGPMSVVGIRLCRSRPVRNSPLPPRAAAQCFHVPVHGQVADVAAAQWPQLHGAGDNHVHNNYVFALNKAPIGMVRQSAYWQGQQCQPRMQISSMLLGPEGLTSGMMMSCCSTGLCTAI